MKVINVQEAKTQLSRYLEQVANGEELIIGKSGNPMARLIPYVEDKPVRKLGGHSCWVADDCWNADPEVEALFYESEIPPTKPPVAAEDNAEYSTK